MAREEQELAILVTARDAASRVLKNVRGQVGALERAARKGISNAGRNIERAAVVGATAAAGAIAYAVKAAGDFEAQLNTINTIARETPDGLAAIGDGIREIARRTGTPLEELTQGYYDLLSAGIDAADAQNVLNAANRLAIGGLATTAQTVDLLTSAINAYGGDASKAGEYADIFAKAVERGKVTADEIAGSFAQVAPVAAQMGIGIDEIAAAYARLTANGVPAAEVTTQMQRALMELLDPNKDLIALQDKLGVNFAKIARDKGLVVALEQMRRAVNGDEAAFQKLFGRAEGFKFALQTTGPNFDAYNADLAAMGDSAGTAAEQMSERQKGLNFQVARLKANVQDAAITIGTELLPVFGDLAEEATGWLQGHQGEIQQFAQELAAGMRDAVTWAKSLDWDAIADSLKAGAGAVKGIVEAFINLPAPIRDLLVGGFVANKFTGGAVMDAAGAILKASFKSMFVTAGVVNVNGGVAGGPGGIAAGGRGMGRFGGIARLGAGFIGADLLMGSSAYDGAGGALGNVGGGALTGFALGGPIGALGGALAGLAKTVAETQSLMTLGEAQRAHSNMPLDALAGASSSELLTKLGAVDTGLAQIKALPFADILHGDAIAELEQMRVEIVAALEENQEASTKNLQPLPDNISKKQQAQFDELRDRAEASRIATVTKGDATKAAVDGTTAAMRAASISITGALRALDLSVVVNSETNVNVRVPVGGSRYASAITTNKYTGGPGGPISEDLL